jgi:Na+-driven multidrug efflux pump
VFDRPVRAILVLSLPAATGFLLVSLEGFLINGMLARTSSPTPTLAAWTLFEQGTRFLAMPVIATSVALLPVTARLWGRGDVDRIRHELRAVLAFAFAYALLFVLPFALFAGEPVVRALADAEDTRRFAELGLIFLPVAVLLMGPLFQFRSLYDGMQRPRPSLFFSAVRTFLLVLPLTWLGVRLAPQFDRPEIVGAFAGYTLGVGLATLSIALWTRGRIHPPVAQPA